MKVLLVEDFDDTRQLMRMFLEWQGCSVVEAADGREAVAYATGTGFNLIMMDLNLPVLDGYEATRQILSHPQSRHIPVVAFSAQCSGERRRKAFEAGCLDCIEKPMDFDKIEGVLKRFADGR
jgi:CheY-like chemotaxis protein